MSEDHDYEMTVTPVVGEGLYVHVECHSCKEKDARIAELERDNRNLHGLNDTLREGIAESEAELAAARDAAFSEGIARGEAVAELAALNGRRCENCKSWEADRVGPEYGTCHQGVLDGLVDTTTNSFGCNQWTARAEEGRE